MPAEAPIVVTFQDYPGLPAPSELTVESSFEDAPTLLHGVSPAQVRRKAVAEDRLEELVSLVDPGAGDTAVFAKSARPKELLPTVALLRKTGAHLVVSPVGAGTAEVVIAALSLGIPVELRPEAGRWDEGSLLEIAEYFLHSPALSTGVAPLVALLDQVAGTEKADLWETEGEKLGRNFFVDTDGRVSLSRRWAEREAFFGRLGDPLERLRASDAWGWLASIERRVFLEMRPCCTCRHYLFCKGFFLDPASGAPDCAPWRACFDRVADAANAQKRAAAGAGA
jgi:hypothetical protein